MRTTGRQKPLETGGGKGLILATEEEREVNEYITSRAIRAGRRL
jgi:hypothetical protein